MLTNESRRTNRVKGNRLCLAVVFLQIGFALLLPINAAAQPKREEPRTIEAVGRATVRVAPDTLRLVLAVETRAKTAKEAAKENARLSTRVTSALEKIVGSKGEVSTSGYALHPRYQYLKSEQRQELVRFTANNSVSVTSSSLDSAGSLIDAGVAAGATSVGSVNFTLRDDESAQRDAVLEAGRRARRRVDAIAESLGVRVGALRHATSEPIRADGPRPYMARGAGAMMAESADASTPISAGDIEVVMAVHVVFEVR